jgi:hypothetical protein
MIQVILSLILLVLVLVNYTNAVYLRHIKPSKYILASEKYGFTGYPKMNNSKVTMEQHQEALLKVFQLAGYFNLPSLWRDLNSIGGIENIELVFKELSTVIQQCKADQKEPHKFDAKCMRMNLFKSDSIDIQDALDLILYIAQHAFNRQIGQERYELVSYEWMNTYADVYLQEARILRLIDREHPSLEKYDSAWIAGAARITLSQRIIDYISYIGYKNIKINGETLVLAGKREIWANIDGISPETKDKLVQASQNNIDIDSLSFSSSTNDESSRINEGKEYILHLAQLYNITLNPIQSFIQYDSKEEYPPDRSPNRIYANYATHETLKLTETLMAQDLLQTYSNTTAAINISIIDTLAEEHTRPDTASTARDAADRFVRRIIDGVYGKRKDFTILFWTNNPYIERQTLSTQREVDQVLKMNGLTEKGVRIKIEGVGFSSKQSLTTVHSELGALMTEKWKIALAQIEQSTGNKPKRNINDLLFQTRQRNGTIPPEPRVND